MTYSKHKKLFALIIFLISLLTINTGCNDTNEEQVEAEAEVNNPMNCTIPGKLELNTDTIDSLKKYEKLN